MLEADDSYKPLEELEGVLNMLNRPDEEEFEVQSEQDRFELIEVLGEGALKEVSHCYDRKAKRAVALARIKPGLESEYDQGLLHEAWLTASLQHPNIIKVYTVEKDAAGRAYFTMDLKDDRTLADLASSVKRVETSLEAFLKVCDAVAYAHSQAIIHLDLKPENIQCSQYGEVLVCDWGLSKRLSLEDEDLPNMDHLLEVEQKTLYGEVKGSLGYLAPEQVQPGGIKDHRTDIYALGALLYFLFTGQPSIRGDKQEVLLKTLEGEITPPRQLGAKMSRSQERIIMKALALKPEDRYQSVEALQEDLRSSLQGLQTSVDPPNLFYATYRFLRRHRKATLITLLVTFLLGGITAYYFVNIKNLESQTELLSEDLEDRKVEVDTLEGQVQNSEREKETLSQELSSNMMANAARKRKEVSWRVWPNPHFENDLALANQLFKLYPQDRVIEYQWYFLNFVTLNFKAIRDKPYEGNNSELIYCSYIANELIEYDCSEGRPTHDLLKSFFKEVRRDLLSREGQRVYPYLLGCVLHYNIFRIGNHNKARANQAIVNCAACLNVRDDGFRIALKHNHHLQLSVNNSFKSAHEMDTQDLLGHLHLEKLTIKAEKPFNFYHLQSAYIRKLDLTGVSKGIYYRNININGLKEIVIKRGTLTEAEIRKYFRCGFSTQYSVTVLD